MKQSPIIYLISGCNGAGKTTFDRGLYLLDPKATSIEAARLLLAKVKESIEQQKMFASTHCGHALRLSLATLFALLQKELGDRFMVNTPSIFTNTQLINSL